MTHTLPTPNVPALRKTWEWVSAEAEKPDVVRAWKQDYWRTTREMNPSFFRDMDACADDLGFDTRDCKTAMCFAGHAADTAGIVWTDGDEVIVDDKVVALIGEEAAADLEEWGYHGIVSVSNFAEVYLGLTGDEAEDLFDGSNSVVAIREVLERVFERAGETL